MNGDSQHNEFYKIKATLNCYLQDDGEEEGVEKRGGKGVVYLFIYLYTRGTILSKTPPPEATNCQTRRIISTLARISILVDT